MARLRPRRFRFWALGGLGLQAEDGRTDEAGLDAAFAANHQRTVELAQDPLADRFVEFGKQLLDIRQAAADGHDGRAGDVDRQRQR